jgi:tripartite-type tricarboxylate transporter receptor subunit TctC
MRSRRHPFVAIDGNAARPGGRASAGDALRGLPAVLLAALITLLAAPAHAETYPARALKLVNVYPPGGSSDVIARFIGQKLSEALGQPVIVENRAGAGGVIGNDYVAKQPADGYTLVLITGAYPVQAVLMKALPFDPLRDLAMVSMLTTYPFVMDVRPDAPYRTLADFIADARRRPGQMNFASSGVGSVHHFSAELFNAMAGTDLTHVPFRGGSAPMTELMAGRVDVLFEAMTLSLPYLQSGRIRALAVTSLARARALPDVPPAADTLPGFEVNSFLGIATTGGVSAAIIGQLNSAVRRILDSPESAQHFVELGGAPGASTPQAMHDFIAREMDKWRLVIEARHIERQ